MFILGLCRIGGMSTLGPALGEHDIDPPVSLLPYQDPKVVNSQTAMFHFTHAFHEEYENPYKQEINRQQPIFNHALKSFEETIRPIPYNAQLIRAARSELATILSLPAHESTTRNDDLTPGQTPDAEMLLTAHNPDPYIAIHIRRGDRHASSFPYRGKYVPLENFVSAAKSTWSRLYDKNAVSPDSAHFPAPPIMYVASDSHGAVREFVSAFPTSTAVFSLSESVDPALRALAPPHEYGQHEFNEMEEQVRISLTRGMIVDLAMLSGMWAWEGDVVPGATICTLRFVRRLPHLQQ
ncbi:hypothetical protein EW026_g1429 [Hermanssonia centrifuga]|uniref:Uncharacterized protein n=1 Tax=Hermanssonia centrifuga TaxID=98765 RepID=A0A4S4KSE1_9APHY|nr:hypothetical protein EW026_g1429 [Hermanssonia centrifuga]